MKLGARQAGIVLAAVAAVLAPVVRGQGASPPDNAELPRMFQEDQDDRKPRLHGIDWAVVKPRDDARLARPGSCTLLAPCAPEPTGGMQR